MVREARGGVGASSAVGEGRYAGGEAFCYGPRVELRMGELDDWTTDSDRGAWWTERSMDR